MPAAAVIPAPIAYIKVVAVKKLVVGFLAGHRCPLIACAEVPRHPSVNPACGFTSRRGAQIFYLEKIRVFQAGLRRNTLAWNNGTGLPPLLLV